MSLGVVVLPSLIAPVLEGACFGGAEMAALALAEGLADRGHRVTLIGLPGSAARGCASWIVSHGTPIFRPGSAAALSASASTPDPFVEIFAMLDARERDLDVLHLHLLDPSALLAADAFALAHPRVRVIATLHLTAVFPATAAVVPSLKHLVLTAPSAFAAASWRAPVIVVPNGISPAELAFLEQAPTRAALAWAGRRSVEKGLGAACEIARRAQMRLLIAGAEAPEGSVRATGDVEDLGLLPRSEVARRLFLRATATLVTSTIPESFSLVALESLATGTPVVAFDSGALHEVIDDGVTGFLVEPGDVAAAASACRAIAGGAIDRRVCRERAIARFDHARTLDLYEELYGWTSSRSSRR